MSEGRARRDGRIEAVIFDLDGTLADSLELIIRAFNAAFREHTGREYSWEEIGSMFGPPESVIAMQAVGPGAADRFLHTYFQFYAANHRALVKPVRGVKELLRDIHKAGIPLAVYTGKGARTAGITLEHLGLGQYLDVIVTGDDVERYKPAPDGVLLACRRLQVAPGRAVYVGDAPSDVVAGRDAGTWTAGVTWAESYGQLVGEAHPDHLFPTTEAFRAWLRGVSAL